jgi:hypothetical protein
VKRSKKSRPKIPRRERKLAAIGLLRRRTKTITRGKQLVEPDPPMQKRRKRKRGETIGQAGVLKRRRSTMKREGRFVKRGLPNSEQMKTLR